jgi:hypothetical protein
MDLELLLSNLDKVRGHCTIPIQGSLAPYLVKVIYQVIVYPPPDVSHNLRGCNSSRDECHKMWFYDNLLSGNLERNISHLYNGLIHR